jgi:hypothetical protein
MESIFNGTVPALRWLTAHDDAKGDCTMRQLLLAAAVGATALMSGYGTAVAQVAIEVPGAGVYVGPTYYDDDYAPRYYRDHRYYDDAYETRARERRNDRNLCGRYAYWDGNACQPGRRP